MSPPLRNIMYLTGQHPVVPGAARLASITHVTLAFMRSSIFNEEEVDRRWPLFMSVAETRSKFPPTTKIMVSIGGWADTAGFEQAARTDASRSRFARNIACMVTDTGADGVDLDWEFPGGHGEDYKIVADSAKTWEIPAYPRLLSAVRAALGPGKVMSAAVPGLPTDMLAFTAATVPSITASLDFLNVMTYDLKTRRDRILGHHTGIVNSLQGIDAYIAAGAAPAQLNLGLAFYLKWFRTRPFEGACAINPYGCETWPMEGDKGEDLGRTGSFSWHDPVPDDLKDSFQRAMTGGRYDDVNGGHYFWDPASRLWWTWDTAEAIRRKFPAVVQSRRLGGVFAWGLGEDAPKWEHVDAVNEALRGLVPAHDEL